jgi:hypothetical protein
MSPPTLSDLQAWFLTAIITPGGAERGLALAHQRHGFGEQDMLRTAGDGRSRLHIYANGYVLRLLECLRADFPVLSKVMGRELFDFFAKAYVWRHPSRSPTLYDLGAGFADFLEHSQPAGMSSEVALQFSFPVQLARLERARSETARASGLEHLAPPLAFDGLALWSAHDAKLHLAPCTRLLALSFPLQAFWEQAVGMADGEALPATPAPETTHIAVARLHYRIGVHVLAPWQFHYLEAAAAGGSARHCALQAAQACALPAGRVLADALLWLPQAAAAALLIVDQSDSKHTEETDRGA